MQKYIFGLFEYVLRFRGTAQSICKDKAVALFWGKLYSFCFVTKCGLCIKKCLDVMRSKILSFYFAFYSFIKQSLRIEDICDAHMFCILATLVTTSRDTLYFSLAFRKIQPQTTIKASVRAYSSFTLQRPLPCYAELA